MRLPLTTSLLALATWVGAAEGPLLTRPGNDLAVINTPHLRVIVPAAQAEALGPLAQRADTLYAHLALEAGYTITRPLTLIVSDDAEDHNGFSSVVPNRIVQVELASSLPRSGIFTGVDETERTLVHEFVHHISNDRNYGFRGVLERIFGRIYPDEFLGLGVAYLSVPAHVTMPSFWHEGIAQWAETAYADPASPWAGRGRDSLTHLVWRLDAQAGEIPSADAWRATYHRWPYGNRVYLYGLAYTRYLEAAYGKAPGLWSLIEEQGRGWAFEFDDAPRRLTGKPHAVMIQEARQALLIEQQGHLATLGSRPLTSLQRLTPPETLVAAPAWLPGGGLLAAYHDIYDIPTMIVLEPDGTLVDLDVMAWDRGEARSVGDGTAVWAESRHSTNPWRRSRIMLRYPDGAIRHLEGDRCRQPDLRRQANGQVEVTAIRQGPAGTQDLVVGAVGQAILGKLPVEWRTVPSQGRAWSPAFRPGSEALSWVETDATGSRLILAPLAEPTKRQVLAEVRGRIIHPAWSADGQRVFLCADHTGVPNAWYVDAQAPGILKPVTHVVGGVVACVPSPDGKELALVAYDRQGNFLARISNDPAQFPTEVPRIDLAWPAPVPAVAVPGPVPRPLTPLPATTGTAPPATPYRGLTELAPLFWTPTTQVTPVGGLGVVAVAADPINSHQVIASLGVGDHDQTLVGSAAYLCAAWTLEIGVLAWRDERTYDNQLYDGAGNGYDLVDTTENVEIRAGYGLLGRQRRFQAYLALGQARTEETSASQDRHQGQTLFNRPAFAGRETYVEGTLAFSSNLLFPTSYTREDGTLAAATWRSSGFGGDLEGQRLVARAAHTISVWPSAGHQLVVGGLVGWTSQDATRTLQGRFAVGPPSTLGIPRGYHETAAIGDYLLGWTLAYRLPVWRPFRGLGTTPFALRQVVVEAFLDGAKVMADSLGDRAPWYRSAGGELHLDTEIWALRLAPGLGVARQLDGPEDTVAYLTLGFAW